ncbi:hypothetical protein F7725_006416 [Dissostichus mawsoni]|uniref:E3 ubiquitin-protein ligase n=1 Tax=Dissostichus mawsoni TaxID=36200 RepID=A0A7J5XTU9_DISMA|nr:hypothetical protein F7725_006416 [Dissostichus mawsoni]
MSRPSSEGAGGGKPGAVKHGGSGGPAASAAISVAAAAAASTGVSSLPGPGTSAAAPSFSLTVGGLQSPELTALFECPVCFDYVLPPILQCQAGHLVCNACRQKLSCCPTCWEEEERYSPFILSAFFLPAPTLRRERERGCITAGTVCVMLCRPRACLSWELGQWRCLLGFPRHHGVAAASAAGLTANSGQQQGSEVRGGRPIGRSKPLTGRQFSSAGCLLSLHHSEKPEHEEVCEFRPHHFMLVLEKQEKYEGHQQFFAVVLLIGTRKQAENFAYRLELNGNRRRLTWEATPRSIHDGVSAAIMNSDCLVFDTSIAHLFADNGNLGINVTISMC